MRCYALRRHFAAADYDYLRRHEAPRYAYLYIC